MSKYEDRQYYGLRIGIDDYNHLNQWANANGVTVAYCLRRGAKDFINNYIKTGIMPPSEIVNPGAAMKKIGDNNA